jgi:hypothetical protein
MAPLYYLVRRGARAASIATLTCGVSLIFLAVTLIISVLVAVAVWRRTRPLANRYSQVAPKRYRRGSS